MEHSCQIIVQLIMSSGQILNLASSDESPCVDSGDGFDLH